MVCQRRGRCDSLRATENRADRTTWSPGRGEVLSCGVGRPPVSAVVGDLPVECSPDVALRSRAWKALRRGRDHPGERPMARRSWKPPSRFLVRGSGATTRVWPVGAR